MDPYTPNQNGTINQVLTLEEAQAQLADLNKSLEMAQSAEDTDEQAVADFQAKIASLTAATTQAQAGRYMRVLQVQQVQVVKESLLLFILLHQLRQGCPSF